jgi:hypothetical protein
MAVAISQATRHDPTDACADEDVRVTELAVRSILEVGKRE